MLIKTIIVTLFTFFMSLGQAIAGDWSVTFSDCGQVYSCYVIRCDYCYSKSDPCECKASSQSFCATDCY